MKSNYWMKEHFTPNELHLHRVKRTLVEKKTRFQKAILADTYSFGRCLILDGEMQSSELDEFIYHECIVHPALIAHPAPRDILVMGGGEGATTRELLRYRSVRNVAMVDIDGEVIDFCKRYLGKWHRGSFNSPRFELVVGDARKYVFETGRKFDIIISDLPTPIEGGPAYLLYTVEFYRRLKRILKPGGILVLQAGSGSLLQITFNAMLYRTLSKVFKKVHAYYAFVPSFDVPWAFILCGDAVDPRKLSAARIDARIRQRVNGALKFYDGTAHAGLFNLPKYLRAGLERQKNVISEKRPVYFFK